MNSIKKKLNEILNGIELTVGGAVFIIVTLALSFYYKRFVDYTMEAFWGQLFLFSMPVGLAFYYFARLAFKKFCYRPSENYLELQHKTNHFQQEVWRRTISGDFYSDHSDIDRLDDMMIEVDMLEQRHPFILYFNQPIVKSVMSAGAAVVSVIITGWQLLGILPIDFLSILCLVIGISFLLGPLGQWLISYSKRHV